MKWRKRESRQQSEEKGSCWATLPPVPRQQAAGDLAPSSKSAFALTGRQQARGEQEGAGEAGSQRLFPWTHSPRDSPSGTVSKRVQSPPLL